MRKIIALHVLFLLLTGCAVYDSSESRGIRTQETVAHEANKGGYYLITPEDIKREYLNNPETLFLVDTRQEWEYQREHIKGAVNLPVNPDWWYPYHPKYRNDLRKVLSSVNNERIIFY